MNNKFLILIMLISGLLLLSACDKIDNSTEETVVEEDTPEEEIIEEVPVEEPELVEEEIIEPVGCTSNDECEWNEVCIERVCGQMTEIYDTEGDCEEKCNFNDVVVTTSDGDELTLFRGQGSYTLAGAIGWKLMSSSDYCLGEDPTPVAIELSYKATGAVIGKEVIILDVGDESDVISHPNMPGSDFTLTVESINEECS